MALDITMEGDDDDREELRRKLRLIREEYDEKLEYEAGFWRKAWNQTKKLGHVFLVQLAAELKMVWERGGREIVTFGLLTAITWLVAPAALPAVAAMSPVLIPVIIWRAFKA